MTNKELGEALSYFIVEVRNESGKEYRPNTIYEIIIAVQHHLRASGKFVNFPDDNVCVMQGFHNLFASGCHGRGREFDKRRDKEVLKRLNNIYN